MTDKEKIRAEIERLMPNDDYENKLDSECLRGERFICKKLLAFIDSLPEEPTTSVWHDTRSEEPIVGRNIVMWYYDHMYSGEYLGEHFFGREKFTLMSDSKWAYFEDLTGL